MSDAEENGSLIGSIYSWGAGWVEYAQQQVTSLLGAEDLEVVNPDSDEGHKGGDLINPNDERQRLWKNFQEYVGRDVTSLISVPVWIMEPFTVLQRMAEIMEYTQLLDQANQCEDRMERLALLMAFAVSPYGANERPWKPFNPILGETFELEVGNGVKFLAEQVSHHPPIGAAHAENEHFTYDIVSAPKSKFLGNSVEIYPVGRSRITLKRTGETFSIIPCTSKAANVVIGRTWVDHYGPLAVTNITTGDKATIELTPCGWFGEGRYEFSGYCVDGETGKAKIRVSGKWNSHCDAADVIDDVTLAEGEERRLWDCEERIDGDQYQRSNFCFQCCSCSGIPEPLETDSRRRPDRFALEKDDSVTSGGWKYDLEEAQRAEKRERENRQDGWRPRWFTPVDADHPAAVTYQNEFGLDEVPCWTWNGEYYKLPQGKKVADPGTVQGQGFKPWQYPEIHTDKVKGQYTS